MILFANAKINLGLHIIDKRTDGYHNLESILYPIPFYDVIEFHPASTFKLQLYGEKIPGPVEENLIAKAYQLLNRKSHLPEIDVHLLKNIPPGTGLGGGSSDAAKLISGLNRHFNLRMNQRQLRKLAESLGGDCPFFIRDVPLLARGKGEILEPVKIDLSGYFLTLAIPQVRIATKNAYDLLDKPVSHHFHLHEIIDEPIEKWGRLLINDFEKVIFPKHPEMKELKDDFMKNGALYTSLSGSGSAVYAIYKKKPSFFKRRPSTQYFIFRL